MKSHTRLNQKERELIAAWKGVGISNKEIARRLNRQPSTIGREIKHNDAGRDENGRLIYEPLHAQSLSHSRKERAWRAKSPLKNKAVYAYVLEKLREGWSPEQISGRLKLEHQNDDHWSIHHETIYRYIYQKENKGKSLWEYLRRKQKRRRQQNGRKAQRVRIPDRVSIHERPEEVNQRSEFGHWEGDSLVGLGKRSGLHTAYERVASFTRLEKMNSLSSEESLRAQEMIYRRLPWEARRSTTLDNGLEHARHGELEQILGIKTYFADPYSAHQRGGNENANLWIRYYFPKGTDFNEVSEEEVRDVEWELNNRPRKRLQFRTALEVFTEYLKGCNR